MNYALNKQKADEGKGSFMRAARKLLPLLSGEKKSAIIAFVAVIFNSGLNLLGPLVVGFAIDHFIQTGDYHGLAICSGLLLLVYMAAFTAQYVQMRTMGGVAQRMLWRLRSQVFDKLQDLPLAFFNQNKAGDLISRINSDTDKLNQFFSQGLMRFAGNFFVVLGAGIFIIVINWRLALMALIPALALAAFTQALTPWVKKRNAKNLTVGGLLSAEIQESISNFRVILAFNRRDYFKSRFEKANQENFKAAVSAGIVNGVFSPVYDFAGNIAQLIVIGYGVYLIGQGYLAIGLMVSFVLYITRFYDPLREVAQLFSTFQIALAGWDRISNILRLKSDLPVLKEGRIGNSNYVVEFKDVSFQYSDAAPDEYVLKHINFKMERGKTYALVGPTGGGKTTTASLIARLFDATDGTVFLDGKDIRTYQPADLTKRIGFILQEPFLFTGTVRENILYGNREHAGFTSEQLAASIHEAGLEKLLTRFDEGLDTKVGTGGSLSLGQRQLIAFIRAILRRPEILILDEATANIDTVTEEMLEEILAKLPKSTTRVIIAHRLNTIDNADEIFFVNGMTLTPAGSMEQAVEMILHGKRKS